MSKRGEPTPNPSRISKKEEEPTPNPSRINKKEEEPTPNPSRREGSANCVQIICYKFSLSRIWK